LLECSNKSSNFWPLKNIFKLSSSSCICVCSIIMCRYAHVCILVWVYSKYKYIIMRLKICNFQAYFDMHAYVSAYVHVCLYPCIQRSPAVPFPYKWIKCM
jgi:hypothetical protein